MTDLLHSALHQRHLSLGARFAEFGGWEMPLQYSGIVAEHKAVREKAGLFDVSHLGTVEVTGTGTIDLLNRSFTNDLERIGPGQAQYTLACTDTGGVVDDLIVYCFADDHALLVPNAANATTIVDLLGQAAPESVTITNLHADRAIIAIQGPASDTIMAQTGLPHGHRYMSFVTADFGGPLTVCRTGYTGERGYEIIVPAERAEAVWDALMRAGAESGLTPAGLGARDTLRTEMGYPLHGHELSTQITPVEAGLGWAVGWQKPEFWGAEALRAQKLAGPPRLARGLRALGRGIPRPGMEVRTVAGEFLGEITSGTFSPTAGVGIGLALLDPAVSVGSTVTVQVRQRSEEFEVVKPPFVATSAR